MFGENKRRIAALEKEIAAFRKELKEIKSEIAALRGQVDALTEEMVVAHLDAEPYIAILQESGRPEKVDTLLCTKKGYESKLRKFILSTVNKRKPKKTNTDGKETPKATE